MERIKALLPVGPEDSNTHHGARRRSRRFPLNAEIEVVRPVPSRGVALNVSVGGIRVVLDKELPPGENCQLKVLFTEDRSSREEARVVWARKLPDGWIYGLEFTNDDRRLPPDDDLSKAA